MATRFVLTPNSAEFPPTAFPQLTIAGTATRRPVLAYDTTTAETAHWTVAAPAGLTGTWTGVVSYAMASATTGGVAFDIAAEAVTAADVLNMGTATSWDTVNGGNAGTVPGTALYMNQISVTLTNMDSVAAADLLRFSVARDVADGADTATGDAYVFAIEIRDGA